jgi:hypothetical protein
MKFYDDTNNLILHLKPHLVNPVAARLVFFFSCLAPFLLSILLENTIVFLSRPFPSKSALISRVNGAVAFQSIGSLTTARPRQSDAEGRNEPSV